MNSIFKFVSQMKKCGCSSTNAETLNLSTKTQKSSSDNKWYVMVAYFVWGAIWFVLGRELVLWRFRLSDNRSKVMAQEHSTAILEFEKNSEREEKGITTYEFNFPTKKVWVKRK